MPQNKGIHRPHLVRIAATIVVNANNVVMKTKQKRTKWEKNISVREKELKRIERID